LGKQGKLGLFDNSLLISAVFGVSLAICLRFQRHNWKKEFKFGPKNIKLQSQAKIKIRWKSCWGNKLAGGCYIGRRQIQNLFGIHFVFVFSFEG